MITTGILILSLVVVSVAIVSSSRDVMIDPVMAVVLNANGVSVLFNEIFLSIDLECRK